MSKSKPSVLVFAPTPLLTVTIEAGADDTPEIHLHAGGQGLWVARMVATLGLPVTLCGPFGDDTGQVLKALIEAENVAVKAIETHAPNGAYVHDRRSGERHVIAEIPASELSRHEADDLYNAALISGLSASVTILTGPHPNSILPADYYRRLGLDLRSNDGVIVADLSGEILDAALEGGLDLLKVSHEELIESGYARNDKPAEIGKGMSKLQERGAVNVVVTRAAEPALARFANDVFEIFAPPLQAGDYRGSGDSFTAGLAAGLARALDPIDILKLAAAAGAVNVTRHGLGTGQREDIEAFSEHITVRPFEARKASAKRPNRKASSQERSA